MDLHNCEGLTHGDHADLQLMQSPQSQHAPTIPASRHSQARSRSGDVSLLRLLTSKRGAAGAAAAQTQRDPIAMARTFLSVGNEYFDEAHYEFAFLCYHASGRLEATGLAFSNAASALLQLGRYGEALAMASSATRIEPAFTMAHVHAGNAQLALGRTLAASASFSKVYTTSSGKLASAFAALARRGLERIDAFSRRCGDARRCIEGGRVADALSCANGAAWIAPAAPRTMLLRAEALLLSGAAREALAPCEAALPLDWLPPRRRAAADAAPGRAAAPLRGGADAAPHERRCAEQLALAYARALAALRRRGDAAEVLRAALVDAPSAERCDALHTATLLRRELARLARLVALSERGDALYAARHFARAVGAFSAALSAVGGPDAELLEKRAAASVQLGRFESAFADCAAALALEPEKQSLRDASRVLRQLLLERSAANGEAPPGFAANAAGASDVPPAQRPRPPRRQQQQRRPPPRPPHLGQKQAERTRTRTSPLQHPSTPPQSHDPYAVLGVASSAPQSAIRNSWRRLAVRYHPDKHSPTSRDAASATFQRIAKAWEILRDEERRAQYDRTQDAYQRHTRRWQRAGAVWT